MSLRRAIWAIYVVTTVSRLLFADQSEIVSKPPASRTDDLVETHFGTAVHDPYRWLENAQSKEVQTWVKSQDDFARQYLGKIPARQKLQERFKQLFYVDEIEAPDEEADRIFYQKHLADHEKPLIYWRSKEDHKEHLLIDVNKLSAAGNLSISRWYPSPDGHYLAYLINPNNADEAILHVMDASTGESLGQDIIPGGNYADVAWTSDSVGFYYLRLPVDSRIADGQRVANATIRFHRLKTDPRLDPLVFDKTGDSKLYLSPSVSRDGQWLFVYSLNGWSSNNVYYRRLDVSTDTFKPLFISTSATAAVKEWNGNFYLYTNQNAPHFQIFKIPVGSVEKKSWQVIVPDREDTTISEMKIAGHDLILSLLKKASSQLEVRDLDGHLIRTVSLPGIGQVSDITGREDADDLYYQFESFTVPHEIFRLSLASGKTSLWAKNQVPVDPAPYRVQQVWYRSKDGTPVSMFIIAKASLKKNGETPFLLQGYGGFDEPILPRFDATLYPWLEAGGAYALPNLRGGDEYGEMWHQGGMLTHKQNAFDDFVAAATFLIQENYTRSDRLAIQGISNGGLLVAAALTQRPDLFRAVMCKVPLTDMIRYPLFGEGQAWIPEYGSPEKEDEFRALLAYSPYHHVQAAAYPSILFISSANDDRVDPMHARKMAAALQAVNRSTNPILLRTQQHAGHGGADLVTAKVEEWTDRLTFLLHELGIEKVKK